jgi:succinate dehydrogenase / fumarate reductase, cytochrome b subunit
MYRGQSGMWLWVLHRLTGIGVLAFLFLHIVDTYLVAFGPVYYNELVFLYHQPAFRFLQVLLIGAVLYHAINGTRVIILDFWEKGINYHKQLFIATTVIFFALWIPAGVLMMIPRH